MDPANYIYLIHDGIVRFENQDNPYRRKYYQKKQILQKTKDVFKIYDKGGGAAGHICTTFNKTVLGTFTHGSWVGEEFEVLKGQTPTFYTATCETRVRALALDKLAFQKSFPAEIKR